MLEPTCNPPGRVLQVIDTEFFQDGKYKTWPDRYYALCQTSLCDDWIPVTKVVYEKYQDRDWSDSIQQGA